MSRRVVYVTYDGLDDPLGHSQVRPYLEGLAGLGHRFEIVSFEKSRTKSPFRNRVQEGMRWTALRYHRRPTVPATAFDMAAGLGTAALVSVLSRADLVHVRSYVPATLMLPWVVVARLPLLFDMRGFWPDEKVDGGAWAPDGRLFRTAKRVERVLLRRADDIVVLTESARSFLANEYPFRKEIGAPIHVIPTCTDLERFRPQGERCQSVAQDLQNAHVLVYVGSLETWYMAPQMARFYVEWRKAVRLAHGVGALTRFLLISRSNPFEVHAVLEAAGIAQELVQRSADYSDVPTLIRWGEAGVCFRLPRFSARGGSPTKLGELLACGVPVAANPIGDVGTVLRDGRGGVIVEDFGDEGLARAANELVDLAKRPEVRSDARHLAERHFRLDDGIKAYDRIYGAAMCRRRAAVGSRAVHS
jgi:glycosyltransferase involved in cell wall biosynthesis